MSEGTPHRPEAGEVLDRPRIAALVGQNLPSLHRYVRCNMGGILRSKENVSDVVQSAVRELLERQDTFVWHNEAAFRAWLCSAAMRKILQKRRHWLAQRRDVRREHPVDGARGSSHRGIASTTTPSALLEQSEALERFERALDELDDDERQILTMRRIFDVPAADIARELELSERTVNWRLSKAASRLAGILARGDAGRSSR